MPIIRRTHVHITSYQQNKKTITFLQKLKKCEFLFSDKITFQLPMRKMTRNQKHFFRQTKEYICTIFSSRIF